MCSGPRETDESSSPVPCLQLHMVGRDFFWSVLGIGRNPSHACRGTWQGVGLISGCDGGAWSVLGIGRNPSHACRGTWQGVGLISGCGAYPFRTYRTQHGAGVP
jgi:hypothetical protein